MSRNRLYRSSGTDGIRLALMIIEAFTPQCFMVEEEEEEVYLPCHRFVKARGHPPQTLQKYRIAFGCYKNNIKKMTPVLTAAIIME